jgi:hypothetical protein
MTEAGPPSGRERGRISLLLLLLVVVVVVVVVAVPSFPFLVLVPQ